MTDDQRTEDHGQKVDEIRAQVKERVDEMEKLGDLRKEVEETVSELQAGVSIPPEKKKDGIPSYLIHQQIYEGDLGLGLLMAEHLKGKLIYNGSTREWYYWDDPYWKRDEIDRALGHVESVNTLLIDEYNRLSERINWALKKNNDQSGVKNLEKLRDDIVKRIYYLRNDKGRNACLKFARTNNIESLALPGEAFDNKPHLFTCQNGVIDLRSGMFREGRPDDYITIACPTAFKGYDEPCQKFKDWLMDVFDDPELISFLQRLLGYAISGTLREHIFVFLFGHGRNGKGTLDTLLTYVLGDFVGAISSEILLASRFQRSSAAPSPDIMGLKGLRIAFATETEEGRKFSSATLKRLTGGNQLVARSPNDKRETRFFPSHTIFLESNFRPQAPGGEDPAFWERVIVIPFFYSFVDREPVGPKEKRVKKGIVEELKAEAPGILAWILKGLFEYQKIGLSSPAIVKDFTAQYRKEEDLIGEFLESNCNVGDGLRVQVKPLHDSFVEWYRMEVTDNEKSIPKIRRFSSLMERRFVKDSSSNVRYFLGLELKSGA